MGLSRELLLASASPRRAELLRQIGVGFRVLAAKVHEQRRKGEAARDYGLRVASEKARAAQAMAGEPMPVLAADTEVVLDGEPLGQPADDAGVAAMLARLSGRSHQVLTAVVLLRPDGALMQTLSCTEVCFARLDPGTIAAYAASGEGRGKAGGYAIQGAAAAFVQHLAGSYSGVVGLPLHETAELLRALPTLKAD